MSAASLHLETHILDLASVGELLLTSATRYTRGPAEESAAFVDAIGTHWQNPSAAAVILVFLHGLGFRTWRNAVSGALTDVWLLSSQTRKHGSRRYRIFSNWRTTPANNSAVRQGSSKLGR